MTCQLEQPQPHVWLDHIPQCPNMKSRKRNSGRERTEQQGLRLGIAATMMDLCGHTEQSEKASWVGRNSGLGCWGDKERCGGEGRSSCRCCEEWTQERAQTVVVAVFERCGLGCWGNSCLLGTPSCKFSANSGLGREGKFSYVRSYEFVFFYFIFLIKKKEFKLNRNMLKSQSVMRHKHG